MLEFTCPSCGKRVQGNEAFPGKQVLCPACNATVTVPLPTSNAMTATGPPRVATSDAAFSEGEPPLPAALPSLRTATPHALRYWLPLLIVVGVVLTAVGLLIPAVRRVRGDAERSQSIGDLCQIGLAFHSFHDGNKRLPFNGTAPARASDNTSGSWAFQILPFIDQAALFAQPNATTGVSVYHCHGRGRPVISTTRAWSDYCINPWLNHPDGVVNAPDIRRRMVDITDGTSNTIFVGHGSIDPKRYSATAEFSQSTDIFKGGNPATARRSTTNQMDKAGDATRTWGSPYSQGALMCMADATVRMFAYETHNGGIIQNGISHHADPRPLIGDGTQPDFNFGMGVFLTPTGGEICVLPDR